TTFGVVIAPAPRRRGRACAATTVQARRRVRLLLRWGHLLRKSACFSMRRESAEWGHLSAKSFMISTNGLIRSESSEVLAASCASRERIAHTNAGSRCTAGCQSRLCPLWVISSQDICEKPAGYVCFAPKADK